MKRILILLLFLSTASYAQTEYWIGSAHIKGSIIRIVGKMILTDSTVTFDFNGSIEVKKIENKTNKYIYVTDGTAIDRITITQNQGTKKGFDHNYMIAIDTDARFNPSEIIYYAYWRE